MLDAILFEGHSRMGSPAAQVRRGRGVRITSTGANPNSCDRCRSKKQGCSPKHREEEEEEECALSVEWRAIEGGSQDGRDRYVTLNTPPLSDNDSYNKAVPLTIVLESGRRVTFQAKIVKARPKSKVVCFARS